MAIVQTIRDSLLGMAGLENVSHGPADLEARIISDINRGLEHIGESNPNVFYQTRPDQAEVIRTPVAVNVTVTQYAKTITFNSGYASSWMPGQAIQIAGDSTLNRIIDENTPSAPALTQPYMGTTGAQTATVYNDWIVLPNDVRAIMEPVTIDKEIVLIPAQSAAGLALQWMDYPCSRWPGYSNFVNALKKISGDPQKWWPYAEMCLGTLRAGIMLDTLPSAPHKLCYDAKKLIFAPVTTLSDTRTSLTPQSKDNEILLPVVRWFFSTYQFCSVTQQSLQPEYTIAMAKASELGITANKMMRKYYSNQR